MNGFLLGIGFLTRFPVSTRAPGPGDWGRAARAFPVAGALVAAVAVLAQAAGSFVWSPLVGAIAAVAAAFWATGGLHVDGWSDCLDGMSCNGDREKTLAVMHDPRAGAVGAAGTTLLLLAKVALVAHAGEVGTGAAAVWVATIGARAFLPLEIVFGTPATPGKGLFAYVAADVRRADAAVALLVAGLLVVPAVVLVPALLPNLGVGVLVAAGVTAAWAASWRARIGGTTGDVLGAAVELRELVLLASLAALAA